MQYSEPVQKFLVAVERVNGKDLANWLEIGKLIAGAETREFCKELGFASMEEWVEHQYALGAFPIQKRETWYAVKAYRGMTSLGMKSKDLSGLNKAQLKELFVLDAEKFQDQIRSIIADHRDMPAAKIKELVAAIKETKSSTVAVDDVLAAQAAEPTASTETVTQTAATTKAKLTLTFPSAACAEDFKALLKKYAPTQDADLGACAQAMVAALFVKPVKVEATLPPLEVEVAAA